MYGYRIQDVEGDICAVGQGYVQNMSGWRKTGSTNCLWGYMDWMFVGTEVDVWHLSEYLPSECIGIYTNKARGQEVMQEI